MKIPFPLPFALCLLAIAGPAGAENAGGTPVPEPRRIVPRLTVPPPPIPAASATPMPADESKLTRFDLDFPGGTPSQLAAAISKATGKHLNLIIPTEVADAKIMPLKIDGVTVPYLFQAITRASNRQIPIRDNSSGNPSVEYRDGTVRFMSDGPISDETVWAFSSNAPTATERALFAGTPAKPPEVCRYFQLASYLENYSIEDITTAIQTGWKMARVEPPPQLSFHKETSLLIAVGPEASVNLIPNVLGQLRLDRGPIIDQIVKLQAEISVAEAKHDAVGEKKAEELRRRVGQLVERQRANEKIENDGRRIIRPAPPSN